MDDQSDTIAADLVAKPVVPEARKFFLLNFTPPAVVSLSQMDALVGAPQLMGNVIRDTEIKGPPAIIDTRDSSLESQASYDASLAGLHQTRKSERPPEYPDIDDEVDSDIRRGWVGGFARRFGFRAPSCSDRLTR